jgi:hypothetical protein
MMQLRVGRIIIAAIAAPALTILSLVLVVALFGPADQAGAEAYAERLGYWVGPIGGFLFCLLGGIWVARGLRASRVLNGFVLGLVVAGIDVAILIAMGATFEPIFAISDIGKVIAGSLGGWIAGYLPSAKSEQKQQPQNA